LTLHLEDKSSLATIMLHQARGGNAGKAALRRNDDVESPWGPRPGSPPEKPRRRSSANST